MNTAAKGQVRYMVFKEGGTWYAVGMEFNIVESGDDPRSALNNLFDALQGYVESFRKIKGARLAPLNQVSDPEYEKLWAALHGNPQKKIRSIYQINTFGVLKV